MTEADVLLVEDNHGDVRLIERAFDTREVPATLHVVQTGDEALDWLFRRGEFDDAPRPAFVLLDLNLPATNGITVLETVKDHDRLHRLPVVVLTSSRSKGDLVAAYEHHANACLRKPVDPAAFMDLVETVTAFWTSTVALPPLVEDGTSRRD